MADLAPGTIFAGCRIDGLLGRGGMGVIYRATELRLGREVALKLISPGLADEAMRTRFEREARLAAAIEHPNVVPIYGAGEEDNVLYLVMRLVQGTDLGALLKAHGPLPAPRAAAVVAQLASALDAAHAAGLVHRDVKPGNVLVGDDDHVYLTDFGITRIEDAHTRITDSGGWIGTVDYMSPEHLRGEPTDARSDVYSLGCVLHAALTGRPPMRRTTIAATIQAHLNDAPPRASLTAGVPTSFDAVVARAMAKDPAERYASAGALANAAIAAGADSSLDATAVALPVATIAAADEPATHAVGGSDTALTTVHRPSREQTATVVAAAAPQRPTAIPIRQASGRRRRRAVIAAVSVALLGGGAWALLRPSDRVSGPITEVEVRGAVNAFASAYSHEDAAALRQVLSLDVQRAAPDARQNGRAAVLAEYERQFAQMAVRGYAVRELAIRAGDVGRAQGEFRVTRSGAAALTGTITFAVVRRGGKPAIALLATQPRPS